MLNGCTGTTETVNSFYLAFKFRAISANILFQNVSVSACSCYYPITYFKFRGKMDQWLKSCLLRHKSGKNNQQITRARQVIKSEPNFMITSDVSVYEQGK